MIFTATDAIRWLNITNNKINEQQNYLTNLDRAIGDGDHGLHMVRGFKAVIENIERKYVARPSSVADIMKNSAMILMTTVGGASGILYATAFLKMATVFQDVIEINHTIFTTALQRAVDGIKRQGNVQYGEKTLLDVWVAVMELFEKSDSFPTADTIERTAYKAMEDTEKCIATKGKAALYGDSSQGHIDPGAASTYYLFVSLAEACKEDNYE